MDSGCSKHVTSHITDYIEYMPFNSPGKAEIADKKELDILGVGTIAICHKMWTAKRATLDYRKCYSCQPQMGDSIRPRLRRRRGVKHIR